MAEIILKNISKSYDSRNKVVKDFSLEINDKEFIVFVGPSGCGKSTTLRMIAGLEDIDSGELYIGGSLVNDLPPKERDIAMVFQNYALYPHMSVYENMAFGLKLRKMEKAEIDKRVKEASVILGIEDLLKRKPRELSGGQKQRVALGRAIVRDPKVFLFDEPLSNLDAKLRVQMRAEISKLHKKLNTTAIYVTHDQVEAMTMADRIVILKDGVIQQVDTPMNIYCKPANKFVAGFIGSPSMNFIEGKIIKKDKYCFISSDGKIRLELNEQFKEPVSEEVTMGVRPEDISLKSPADSEDGLLAEVDLFETLGNETLIYLNIGNSRLVCRAASDSMDHKDKVQKVTLGRDKIHLFDTRSGETISYN
ncbi:MAG: ABC transporter ATP-binding protein [Ignavibacteriales bacterium]